MSDTTTLRVDSERLAEVCSRYDVKRLSLFGSFARGDQNQNSDIDLLVEFSHGSRVGLWRFGQLESDLSEIFGRRVDLVSMGGLKVRIRSSVLHDAQLLYAA